MHGKYLGHAKLVACVQLGYVMCSNPMIVSQQLTFNVFS
jgi:hypothetical protein